LNLTHVKNYVFVMNQSACKTLQSGKHEGAAAADFLGLDWKEPDMEGPGGRRLRRPKI
jgi:hypothetical protein